MHHQSLNNYPGVPQVRNTQVSVKARTRQDNRSLNFSAQSVGECTEQYPTQGFAYLRSVVGNLSVTVNLTINNALLSGITREVPSDKHYFLDMMLHNKAGSILSTQLTKFSTFDMQGLVLGRTRAGLACFACTFLEGSRAKGCLIHLMSRGSIHSVTSHRPTSNHHRSDWNCIGQFSDGLTARIFDVEFDGSVSSNPALVVESVTIDDSVTLVSYAADSTGTPIATSTICAPIADGGSTPIIAALVSVFTVIIFTLAVLVLIVLIAVHRRRKIPDTQEAHHRVNAKFQKGNSKDEEMTFTDPNPVCDAAQSATKNCEVISIAANPLCGSSGNSEIQSACDDHDAVKEDCGNDK